MVNPNVETADISIKIKNNQLVSCNSNSKK